jgi:hypothetical protein
MKLALSIIGFPKCATSSLWQYFNNNSNLAGLKSPNDSIEYDITSNLSALEMPVAEAQGVLVKYSSCIYSRQKVRAWHQMLKEQSYPAYLISIGDPKSRCISWFRFHKELALSGRNPNHFAYIDRDKYLSMTLDSYFDERGRQLDYAHNIGSVFKLLQEYPVLIVEMDCLKSRLHDINAWVESLGVSIKPGASLSFRNRNRGALIEESESFSPPNLLELESYREKIMQLKKEIPPRWTWI